MRGLRLGDSLLLFGAYVSRAATQALLLWTFARTAGAAGAGEFALAFAVSTPVVIGFELALRYVFQTLDDAPGFRVFFGLRVVCATVAISLVGTAAVAGVLPVQLSVMAPLLAMKWADSVLDICIADLQKLGRNRRAAAWIWANTAMSVLAITGTLATGADPEWAVLGSAAASFIVLSLVAPELLSSQSGPWFANRHDLRRILRAGATLGLAQTLMATLAYLPMFYLARGADKAAVGVFAVCQYTVTFASLFYASAAQAWVSDLRRAFLDGGRQLLISHARRVAVYFIAVGAMGGALTLLLLPTALPKAFGSEFDVATTTFVPFALAVLLLGVESSFSVVLIVLNRYASRLAAAAAGIVATTSLGALTIANADVQLAGYLVLFGVAARCVVSGWRLRAALRK